MGSSTQKEIMKLHREIASLREEVDQLKRTLFIVASTVALAEGDQAITHSYLRRVIAQVEGTSRDRLKRDAMMSREFVAPAERSLDLMAKRAGEMNLPDFADWLQE